jgi:hypothetical protein
VRSLQASPEEQVVPAVVERLSAGDVPRLRAGVRKETLAPAVARIEGDVRCRWRVSAEARRVSWRAQVLTVQPTASDLLDLDIDVRLGAETWAQVWEAASPSDALISALLRLAYGLGYVDALSEPIEGRLCLEHGLQVPQRERP